MDAIQPGPTEAFGGASPPAWIDARAGYRVPVRRFAEGALRPPVVMLHGLQSHSGWFVQSATRIASAGFPVHAFDRCGSGVSEVDCDGGSGFSGLLEELDAVVANALDGTGHHSVYLVGHCFGAIPAVLYAGLHRPERVAGLALTSPAFHTHTDLALGEKARVVWSVLTRRTTPVPVPIAPADFSEQTPFVAFIENDPLVRTEFPARFLFELGRARLKLRRALSRLRAPLLVAMAGEDPICDNPRNRRLLQAVTTPMTMREYAGARHILEFSGRREEFLSDLADWLHRQDGG